MIERLIAFCLQQRLMVIGATMAIAISGIIAFENLPVQAFPDVQNVFVQVVTQYPGQAPEEVEKLISLPIERVMNGLPHLMNMRSVSIFGLSVVTLTFDDSAEDYFSRQQVLERLQNADIPNDSKPQLGPLSTGVGEILRYVVDAKNLPLVEQRALQDWVIEPKIRAVQGVADVVSYGGGVKEYKISAKPDRLKNYHIDLKQVFDAISANNSNTGGGYIEYGDEALVVRGIGLLKSAEEIGEIVVDSNDGVPVRIKDVADISIGPQPRTGIVAMNQRDDIVEGIVLLIKGRDAVNVLGGVKEKIKELNDFGLPPGVKITPIYDRTELVGHTVHTVEHNMLEGATLIMIILLVFLRRFMAAFLVTLIIPLSLLFAFILVDLGGISANLISLGAIDFGIIVDSAVVLVEAVMVQVTLDLHRNADIRHLRQTLLITATEMGRPILFSKAIIIIAFLPIFTFQRVEAKIFSPMAYTLSFALIASMLFSLTFVPAMLTYLLGPKMAESHNPLVQAMEKHYRRILEWVLRHAKTVFISSIAALILSFASVKLIGTEFMPKLDEGNIWLTITLPTPVSLTTAKELERKVRDKLETFSEAKMVLTQLGRPEDGTDPNISPVLRGDPTRIKQVLINYASNAIKFTEKGEITLRIKILEETATDYFLRFEVQDTGIGMTQETQNRLFRSFQQADASSTRLYGGTGLGLAISKSLIEKMGGEIGVISQLGHGSLFWFNVRLGKGNERLILDKQDAMSVNIDLLCGVRILLVEDHPFNQQIASEFLTVVGVTVQIANNGQEALDLLRNERFDCVLMDMQMPVMGGIEATRKIRAIPSLADLPIIAMTANATGEDKEECLNAGMNDFISKPFFADHFYRKLLLWLSKKGDIQTKPKAKA